MKQDQILLTRTHADGTQTEYRFQLSHVRVAAAKAALTASRHKEAEVGEEEQTNIFIDAFLKDKTVSLIEEVQRPAPADGPTPHF